MTSAVYNAIAKALCTERTMIKGKFISQKDLDKMTSSLSRVFVVQQAQLIVAKKRAEIATQYVLTKSKDKNDIEQYNKANGRARDTNAARVRARVGHTGRRAWRWP